MDIRTLPEVFPLKRILLHETCSRESLRSEYLQHLISFINKIDFYLISMQLSWAMNRFTTVSLTALFYQDLITYTRFFLIQLKCANSELQITVERENCQNYSLYKREKRLFIRKRFKRYCWGSEISLFPLMVT